MTSVFSLSINYMNWEKTSTIYYLTMQFLKTPHATRYFSFTE
jgi:hypothetical protein